MKDRAYLAPIPFGKTPTEICTPDELTAWSKDIISDGRSYLRLQPAYPYIQDGINIVNGEGQHAAVQSLSSVRTDQTVRNVKELVAAQTNIRIIPAFKSDIPEFRHQTDILNRAFMSWQGMTFADRRLRKAWQYAEAAGTGYIGVRYDPNYYYKGHGDNVLDSYGPLDVLPVGMGRQHDIQKAYAVALRVETPLHEAWRLFPMHVDQITPTRATSMGRGTVISQAVKFATATLRRFGQGIKTEHEAAPWEMVDVFYIYVDDDSVNDTGAPIDMRGPDGQPGTSWCYTVPYIGQEIKVGTRNGDPVYRRANRSDCLLYPNRRLIVMVEGIPVNPDPAFQASPYWHAKVPVAQFRSDDWAWNFLGFPMTRYGQSLEKASVEMWRGMIDAMNGRLSPARAYDRNNTSASAAAALNTRVPNQYVGLDLGLLGDNALPKPLLPFQWYEYPPHYLTAQEQLRSMIKDQMGTADTAALARARQLPSGDSQEKLLESLGPLVKDQSRNMEESIRMIGELWKSNFFQFITAARRLQILGPDGLAEEDYDYEPGTLIPASQELIDARRTREWKGAEISTQFESRLSGELWEKYEGTGDVVPQFERARWHKDNFPFSVVPYSLHEFNSMTRKLMYIQRKKAGFPMDPWTEAELFDDRNFGDPPNLEDPETGEWRKPRTGLERWMVWQRMLVGIKSALAGPGAGGAVGPGGARGGAGRPGTDQQPPTLESKSTGASTIRTSKHSQ